MAKGADTKEQEQEKVGVVPWTIDDYLDKHPDRDHVVDVVETSEKTGRPSLLLIECVVCGNGRRIKPQDAFQTKTCSTKCKTSLKKKQKEEAKE